MNICILIGTFRPDIAYKVMTEFSPQIRSHLNFRIFAEKLVIERIINERQRKKVIDESTRHSNEERMDELLDLVKSSVKADGDIFRVLLKILLEEDTRATEILYGDMMNKYKKYFSEKKHV